ncbi:MAG TPA: hypothetical protein VH044_13270 [Polyangiaceae bacterium]|nr:hypothetical protein [Polyangiaceae bacterium]
MNALPTIARAAAAARVLADALEELQRALETQAAPRPSAPGGPCLSDTDRARARRVLRRLGGRSPQGNGP